MKIHDKFVIELAEVIKGYANDYQVYDPAHLPCDYKFYEIGGVAICEESFKKMKPLEDEINAVLDKLRDEIKKPLQINEGLNTESAKAQAIALSWVLEVIDKYKGESGNVN